MAALELDVVELMAKHTAARLAGMVGMIRGLANPKSGVARWTLLAGRKGACMCDTHQDQHVY
jgi:hypothetical protein